MTTRTFNVAPVAGALGAEITGVDLRSADGVLARTQATRSMRIDTTDDALAEHEHPT